MGRGRLPAVSQDPQLERIASQMVVYDLPGKEAVTVRRDVPYGDDGTLTMDLYFPPGAPPAAPLPAVVVVAGFPDPGVRRIFGRPGKEMGSAVSWGRLMAASGLVAVTSTNREPAADARALLEHLRRNGPALGIDPTRIGLLARSGNVPLALSLLIDERPDAFRCAVLCYGYMLDLDGATGVAEAAAQFGFVTPAAGRSVADLPAGTPLFVARAGEDRTAGLNEGIDRFVAQALARDLPLTLVNLARAPHTFDLFDDSEESREVVRRILAFLRFHLSAPAGAAVADGAQREPK
jgi:hypothetical protein